MPDSDGDDSRESLTGTPNCSSEVVWWSWPMSDQNRDDHNCCVASRRWRRPNVVHPSLLLPLQFASWYCLYLYFKMADCGRQSRGVASVNSWFLLTFCCVRAWWSGKDGHNAILTQMCYFLKLANVSNCYEGYIFYVLYEIRQKWTISKSNVTRDHTGDAWGLAHGWDFRMFPTQGLWSARGRLPGCSIKYSII